jgi:hemerythrin superfamily protein
MDAIELLEHDHRMVEQLLRDYEAAASSEQKQGVVDIVVRELSKHAALEELLFYPLVEKVLPDAKRQVDDQLRGHMTVKRLLARLDAGPLQDEEANELVDALRVEVHHHVEEEENGLMPQVRRAVDAQALEELGEVIDKAKQTAPTRPHPSAPDRPPSLALAAPVVAIYDRLRDRLQGRPLT